MWDSSALAASTAFGFLDRNQQTSAHALNPSLIWNGPDDSMLAAIKHELRSANHFVFSVAFITTSALAMLKQELLDYQGTGEIITSTYLGFNEPAMFEELLKLENVKVWVHDDPNVGFHAKGYVFHREDSLTAIVGSSNLTDRALKSNHEWNLKFSASPDGHIAEDISRAIERQRASSIQLTPTWIFNYESVRKVSKVVVLPEADNALDISGVITPNAMQTDALDRIRSLRQSGERRGVVISATGTGKTILAALALKDAQPKRALFIVHREQILKKAMSEFQRVLGRPISDFGLLAGGVREVDRPFVFATIQSLSQRSTLEKFDREEFDYVIVDEVHRSGARTYREVIDYFAPKFLLGLTATPERTDDFNVFELFDYNVPYEIRLQAALESQMLVPFHYFGVTDYVDDSQNVIDESSNLSRLVAPERVKHLVRMISEYGHTRAVKGLMFCSNVKESDELSQLLNREEVNGRRLRTISLSGSTTQDERERAVSDLEAGRLDYLLTVDIFNEGIDIPSVNQVVMLRHTQSAIIFTQQLGRGLRKFAGKDHLRVIDFIGNYKNNYMIPIALFGENSRNKDRIREHLIDNRSDNSIAGVSTVNFDEIAQARVLASIQSAGLDWMSELKSEIRTLKARIGRLPKLFDFVDHDTADPVLLAGKYGNYWELLKRAKFVDLGPSAEQSALLTFLSKELLSGKRPHELVLLRELLVRKRLTAESVAQLFLDAALETSEEIIQSVGRVLSLAFYTDAEFKKFGSRPIVEFEKSTFVLDTNFIEMYENSSTFRLHVDDCIVTGLFLARHRDTWSADMTVGGRYSRREVCRLLNFRSNQESTLFGYKVDDFSMTCPIFVTHHKSDDIVATTKYEDELLDERTLHWFTKNGRTMESPEVRKILSGDYVIHVFVKKDDAEGNDHFYLGVANPSNPIETTMPDDDGTPKSVVTMDLNLESPVETQLFEYLRTHLER